MKGMLMLDGIADTASLMTGSMGLQRGWQEIIPLATPAPGGFTVTRTVPGGYWERLVLFAGALVTDATVGNRFPGFNILSPDGQLLWSQHVTGAVPTAVGAQFYGAIGTPTSLGSNGASWTSIPDLVLPSGYQVQFSMANIGAADQVSGLLLTVQRFSNEYASGMDFNDEPSMLRRLVSLLRDVP
jgi:hypothetical protein